MSDKCKEHARCDAGPLSPFPYKCYVCGAVSIDGVTWAHTPDYPPRNDKRRERIIRAIEDKSGVVGNRTYVHSLEWHMATLGAAADWIIKLQDALRYACFKGKDLVEIYRINQWQEDPDYGLTEEDDEG